MLNVKGARFNKETLVGAYALAQLPRKYNRKDVGLYCDDGLAVHRDISGSETDRIRKDLIKRFGALGLKITIRTFLKIVNFLDLTFDLSTGKYCPFRKPNAQPSYVYTRSNRPPSISGRIRWGWLADIQMEVYFANVVLLHVFAEIIFSMALQWNETRFILTWLL